jgi:hypothetical protein
MRFVMLLLFDSVFQKLAIANIFIFYDVKHTIVSGTYNASIKVDMDRKNCFFIAIKIVYFQFENKQFW